MNLPFAGLSCVGCSDMGKVLSEALISRFLVQCTRDDLKSGHRVQVCDFAAIYPVQGHFRENR